MDRLSPKIELINHFDNLIHRIDIDIEKSIKKFNKDQLLGELKCFQVKERKNICQIDFFRFEYFDSNKPLQGNNCDEWSESTKVIDYLNQVRQRTIEKLRKAQEDSLEYLNNNLSHIKDSKDIEEMKSRLFADKFYFQVLYKPPENGVSWVFNLFTFVVDFYLPPTHIECLENLLNLNKETIRDYSQSSHIFDEVFFLNITMSELLLKNLKTKQYPSHLMNFRKQALSNIKSVHLLNLGIEGNFDLSSSIFSNLEKINVCNSILHVQIQHLSSLKSLALNLSSIEGTPNQNSIRELSLAINNIEINNDWLTNLFEIFPDVEELCLKGNFSNINFDSFFNLKKLSISGLLLDDFNFDLFKNICNQLEFLEVKFDNIDDEKISNFLIGHIFPNVLSLEISNSKITRLGKKLFDGFPKLQSFYANRNKALQIIDKDAFLNSKNLKQLTFNFNEELSELDAELFSCLQNLEKLDLLHNKLTRFDLKIMDYIKDKIKAIYLAENLIKNKSEVNDYFKESKILLFLW